MTKEQRCYETARLYSQVRADHRDKSFFHWPPSDGDRAEIARRASKKFQDFN